MSGAERTDQNQPDDRKWAHSTRATGAPGEPNRKIRAGGHAGVWVGTGDPGSLSQMLRWHLGDRRTKCCSALRSTESQNRREKGAGLSLLTPPTHSPPSSVPRRLASEDRIPQGPGFPTAFSPVGPHQAKIGGREERRASSMTCPGQGLEAAGARPALPALGAVAAPTARLSVPL